MERFKNFSGFLSLFFAVLLVASVGWTIYQTNQLSEKIRPVENKIASFDRAVNENTDRLTRLEEELEEFQNLTLRSMDTCVEFNIEENGASEAESEAFCVDTYTNENAFKLNGLETSIEQTTTNIAAQQIGLAEARSDLQVLEVARQSVQQTGLWLGVGLLAIWGGFHLAYLWGSHKWKTENEFD